MRQKKESERLVRRRSGFCPPTGRGAHKEKSTGLEWISLRQLELKVVWDLAKVGKKLVFSI
jgi:hypothetical protein